MGNSYICTASLLQFISQKSRDCALHVSNLNPHKCDIYIVMRKANKIIFLLLQRAKGFMCLQVAVKAWWQDILEQFAIRKEVWVGGWETAHAQHVSCVLEVHDIEHKMV